MPEESLHFLLAFFFRIISSTGILTHLDIVDAKTEIIVFSSVFLVMPSWKELPNFATS